MPCGPWHCFWASPAIMLWASTWEQECRVPWAPPAHSCHPRRQPQACRCFPGAVGDLTTTCEEGALSTNVLPVDVCVNMTN